MSSKELSTVEAEKIISSFNKVDSTKEDSKKEDSKRAKNTPEKKNKPKKISKK